MVDFAGEDSILTTHVMGPCLNWTILKVKLSAAKDLDVLYRVPLLTSYQDRITHVLYSKHDWCPRSFGKAPEPSFDRLSLPPTRHQCRNI